MAFSKVSAVLLALPLVASILTVQRKVKGVCLTTGLYEQEQVNGKGEWSEASRSSNECHNVAGLLAVRICGPGTLTVFADRDCGGTSKESVMTASAVNATTETPPNYAGCSGGEAGITANKNIMSYKVVCAAGMSEF